MRCISFEYFTYIMWDANFFFYFYTFNHEFIVLTIFFPLLFHKQKVYLALDCFPGLFFFYMIAWFSNYELQYSMNKANKKKTKQNKTKQKWERERNVDFRYYYALLFNAYTYNGRHVVRPSTVPSIFVLPYPDLKVILFPTVVINLCSSWLEFAHSLILRACYLVTPSYFKMHSLKSK